MMNTMGKTMMVMFIMITGYSVMAQNIDQKKMNKDIEIAEDILMSMMKQDPDIIYDLVSEPSGMYVPDYGVIFNISGSASPFRVLEHWKVNNVLGGSNFDFDFNFSDSFVVDTEEIKRKAQRMAREAQRMARENQKILSEESEVLAEEAEEMAKEAEKEARRAERMVKKYQKEEDVEIEEEVGIEEDVKVNVHVIAEHPHPQRAKPVINISGVQHVESIDSANFRQLMIDFLVDYSGLIGQLKPDQKIMVTSGTGGRRQFGRSYYNGKLTAEITKKDLDDHRNEKIPREELVERIKFDKTDDTKGYGKDLKLFATIFERLYEYDLAETYYLSRGLSYEKLPNFGVIYNMRMYSSKEHNGKYSMPTQKLYDLSFDERNKKVQELYPKFEKELKGNILEYGKTIKSLKPNETILFQVRLTECKACDMPGNIDVSVKQSVLSDYNSGKLTKSAALAKVNIKKDNK